MSTLMNAPSSLGAVRLDQQLPALFAAGAIERVEVGIERRELDAQVDADRTHDTRASSAQPSASEARLSSTSR